MTLKRELKLLLESIRARLRDYPSVNELLANEEETSDRLLAEFVRQVIDQFNALPPLLRVKYSWKTFPDRALLIDGVIALVLQSVGHADTRNFMPSVDGGTTVAPHQKGTFLVQHGASLWAQVVERMRQLRMALNANTSALSLGSFELEMDVLYSLIDPSLG